MEIQDEYYFCDELQVSEADSGVSSYQEDHGEPTKKRKRISGPSPSATPSCSTPKQDYHGEMLDFNSFCLRPELSEALRRRNFSKPSQAQAIGLPVALAGHDLLLQSKAGSGKTAVFCLATLQTMQFADSVTVLAILPTRELALQVTNEFQAFAEFLPNCRIQALFGGMGDKRDTLILEHKTPNVVVGTPGKLVTLLRNGRLNLRHVTHFIVDECDKVLCPSTGMSNDVRELLESCPEERQVMMFTGTISRTEAEREQRFMKLMHCPRLLLVEDPSKLTLTGVSQFRVDLQSDAEKSRTLLDVLDRIDYNQVVIFVNTINRCQALHSLLNREGLECTPFHSGIEQVERLKNFGEFKHFLRRILIATDVMGRGIDYEFVTCVINYDVPLSADTYMHRVGRTGRMRKRGIAISLCVSQDSNDPEVLSTVEKRYLTDIEELPETLDTSALIFS